MFPSLRQHPSSPVACAPAYRRGAMGLFRARLLVALIEQESET